MHAWLWLFFLISCGSIAHGGDEKKSSPPAISVKEGSLNPFWLKSQNPKEPISVFKIASLHVHSHQVTNENFIFFLKTHPEWKKSQVPSLYAEASYLSQFSDDSELKEGVHPKAPVTHVSWFAASAYCRHLGMRLPTIVEWEYLAAADEKSAFAYGEAAFLNRILEWYGSTHEALKPVQGIYKNKYGVHDMHGLVWEWVGDFNSNFMTGESREDSSFNRNLFCGAGSLASGDKENYAAFMRFAFRSSLKGKSSIWNLGFRCVKEES
ncbi:MAG: formylglycine-generating enzyme family protein [Pseudobdellovibrionaceae bacterium]